MSDQVNQEYLDSTGYWGSAGAGAILYSPKRGLFGIGRRSAEVQEPGTLGSFGGAIESGDSPKETVKNELMEEVGCYDVTELKELLQYRDGDFVYHNFVAVVNDDLFMETLNWENDEIVWSSLERIRSTADDEIHYGLKAVLADPQSIQVLEDVEREYDPEANEPSTLDF